eukprot:gene15902-6503_t
MFDELLPHIKLYLAPSRPQSDHFMAIATIGECCKAMRDKIQWCAPSHVVVPQLALRLELPDH